MDVSLATPSSPSPVSSPVSFPASPQLPEEARDLDKELRQVTKDKDAAVR